MVFSFTIDGPRRLVLGAALLVTILGTQSGCVRRRLTIQSSPPGALVYIDDQFIGSTPVSTSYVYYGVRNIRLIKDGFEPVEVKRRFQTPWYEIPPLDFVSENLWPEEIRDERDLFFQLEPQRIVAPSELLSRAQNLRQNARQGVVTPLPPRSAPPLQGAAPPVGHPVWNPPLRAPASSPERAPISAPIPQAQSLHWR